MSNYLQSKVSRYYRIKPEYFTRKDYRHEFSYYRAKSGKRDLKHITNVKIRNFKGDMQDGGWYKRFCDPWCWD